MGKATFWFTRFVTGGSNSLLRKGRLPDAELDIVSLLKNRLTSCVHPKFALAFFLILPCLTSAQSDFKLSTATMPSLEDAITPLPTPVLDAFVRESMDREKQRGPKADEVLKQAVNALKTRQYDMALPRLEYLQSMRPAEPDILILRGCIYAESGHFAAAESVFLKAVQIAPTHPWGRLNLAEAQISQKKYAQAEKTLTILVATRPESEVVRFKLVLTLALQNKIANAETELEPLARNAATPAFQFGSAAIAFAKGEADNGRLFIKQGQRLFTEAQSNYFYNSLASQGWVPKTP